MTEETKEKVDELCDKVIDSLRLIDAHAMGPVAWQYNQELLAYVHERLMEKGISKFASLVNPQ